MFARIAWVLWRKRKFLHEDRIRFIAQEEAKNFYRWAVIHGGIEVPLRAYQLRPENDFEAWKARIASSEDLWRE